MRSDKKLFHKLGSRQRRRFMFGSYMYTVVKTPRPKSMEPANYMGILGWGLFSVIKTK
jgi:hypothetical protein